MSINYPDNIIGRQRGATLIVALLVVIAVVTVVTRMSTTYLLLFRSVENQVQLQQVHSYLRSTEDLARELLLADLLSGSTNDSTLDLWAQVLALPLPEGELQACVQDLQGRLNLNDLLAMSAQDYSAAQKRFIRLLQLLPVEPALAQADAIALANAVFDWGDTDSNTRAPGGAETVDYQRLGLPYRAANQGFASVSELRQIAGMTPVLVAALTAYLGVWGNGSMNLNSLDVGQQQVAVTANDGGLLRASERTGSVLLRTLNDARSMLPSTEEAANRIISLRQQAGGAVADLGLFRQGDLAALQWELEGIEVKSDYFQLYARLQADQRRYAYQAVLQRRVNAGGQPEVVVRSRTFNNLSTTEFPCDTAVP